ncbi:hypothetical protein BT93_E1147 [Corymbia citriodora subsp. variegata]|nr:hypothetical protein BT93_E1147 [Corymbia citriodora subsp. variegata]
MSSSPPSRPPPQRPLSPNHDIPPQTEARLQGRARRHQRSALRCHACRERRQGPQVLLLLEPSGGGGTDPHFTLSNQLLVTWLPKPAPISWLVGAGAGTGARDSCHRLLCFEDPLDGVTYLLNPLTREAISVSVGSSAALCEQPPCLRRIAIGLDCVTGQYKILGVGLFFDEQLEFLSSRADVLDQGSRSWRDIRSVPPCFLHLLGDPVSATGSIHWGIVTGRDHSFQISSFDPSQRRSSC